MCWSLEQKKGAGTNQVTSKGRVGGGPRTGCPAVPVHLSTPRLHPKASSSLFTINLQPPHYWPIVLLSCLSLGLRETVACQVTQLVKGKKLCRVSVCEIL